jgi:hypothetical protein
MMALVGRQTRVQVLPVPVGALSLSAENSLAFNHRAGTPRLLALQSGRTNLSRGRRPSGRSPISTHSPLTDPSVTR